MLVLLTAPYSMKGKKEFSGQVTVGNARILVFCGKEHSCLVYHQTDTSMSHGLLGDHTCCVQDHHRVKQQKTR